ncbi:hypothetical protein JCM11641_006164 [Rhodosporidiobolus odoratus]
MPLPPFSSSLSTSPQKYGHSGPSPDPPPQRPPQSQPQPGPSHNSPHRASFIGPVASRAAMREPQRGVSGSSAGASRGPSPSRRPGGEGDGADDLWPPQPRRGSGDALSSASGSSRAGSRKDSGHSDGKEPSDPGFAGRGAGGFGSDKRAGGGALPVLNTYMLLPAGSAGAMGGLLSPTGSSNHSHGSGEGSRHRDSYGLPPPHRPFANGGASVSGSTTSPSTQNSSPAFPRSPSFGPARHSPAPSPTFPPSHSNSTLSSHSHSQSHSNAGLSPTVASFPQPHLPFSSADRPPSRPGSAASHAPSHSHPQHHAQPSSSALAAPSSRSGPRQRGDSGGSSGSSSSSNGGPRAKSRERGQSGGSGGAGSGKASSGEGGSAGSGSGSGEKRNASGQALCAKCELPMTGQFVRALRTVYHLDCFRCLDCNRIVAAKFFPIDDPTPDSSFSPTKQVPLCETDYFRRLSLLCNKCGQALRGSYITALDMKFHVEHFTCSVCPTVFGPQDSYYEHAGSVYCHFHYSTRFAVKCTGCRTAILKQFVEINRNNVDEHWHPECYMIHKFWNIKLAPTPKAIERPPSVTDPADASAVPPPASAPSPPVDDEADYIAQEGTETPDTLKTRQKRMEEQVYRIWTILSAFEESSAACISEMLRHVSSGHYMEGVGMAEKFVLHVETLFAAIDDLNSAFRAAGAKEMAHVREARMLCKKVVNFFMLLSHTHETGARKMSITQELLSLVTGLAHYLKILIRIALSGALKLEREHNNPGAIGIFLGRLDRLARDPDANRISSTTPAIVRGQAASSNASHGEPAPSRKNSDQSASDGTIPPSPGQKTLGPLSSPPSSTTPIPRTPTRQPYGYKSLTRAVGTLVGQGEATTDLCEGCRLTVEEECARLGTSIRWHLACLKCPHCNRCASKDVVVPGSEEAIKEAWVKEFVWVPDSSPGSGGEEEGGVAGSGLSLGAPTAGGKLVGGGTPFCEECAQRERGGSLEGTLGGFEYVTRLEQYAFLLCVALNKLFGRLKQRGVVPGPPPDDDEPRSLSDAYRDSTDIKRMKSVQLDRKLSSTTARLPKRSIVVQSPSGRTAQSDSDPTFSLFQAKPPVPSRKDQPLVDPIKGTVVPRNQVPAPSAAKPPQPHSTAPSIVSPSPGLAPITSPPLHIQPGQPGLGAPQRPSFSRSTTAVRIVDEPLPLDQSITTRQLFISGGEPDGPVLGGIAEPTQDEDGLTLADLPKALEAEQKRAAVSDQYGQSSENVQGGRVSPVSHGPSFNASNREGRDRSATRGGAGAGPALGGGAGGPKLLSELSALEYFIVKHVAAVLLSNEPGLRDVITLEELLDIIDARKNTFWGKLFKGGEKKKEVKKKGVFGIPLEVLVERNGADSMHGASPGSLRIPSFVDDVISAMKQMDMSIEGIFRKNGNIRRLKDLTEALDRDSGAVSLSDDNPVQLAALLKKFLRDLPDPLMTFKLFQLFIAAQRIEDEDSRKKVLHFCCCLLPKQHRDTMEVLFVFLKWVASFSHVDEETGSKMDLQNLATVISPNILYAKGKDPARDESFSAARVVHELLELQDEFWEVPPECLSILNDRELFANPSQLTSKEILARAENHVRLNGRGGFKNSGVHISRGEASAPQRPGLQEAWSAPAVPGSGPSMRPLSTSVSPTTLRPLDGRPLSISNQPGSGFSGSHPHLPHASFPSGSRSAASTPGSAPNGPWTPPSVPVGRYEEPYNRRGGSEGNQSSSSLHRMPPPPQPQQAPAPHPHPYNQPMSVQQR